MFFMIYFSLYLYNYVTLYLIIYRTIKEYIIYFNLITSRSWRKVIYVHISMYIIFATGLTFNLYLK